MAFLKLLFFKFKYILIFSIFFQNINVIVVANKNETTLNTKSFLESDSVYVSDYMYLNWCGYGLQYFLYKLSNVEDNNTLKTMATSISDDKTRQEIFLMSLVSSSIVISTSAMKSYSDFFDQATLLWTSTSQPRSLGWGWINAWFVDIYIKILTENWYYDFGSFWANYQSYVDKYIETNQSTLISPTNSQTYTLNDYHYQDQSESAWNNYAQLQYKTAIDFASTTKENPQVFDFKHNIDSNSFDNIYDNIINNLYGDDVKYQQPMNYFDQWSKACNSTLVDKYNSLISDNSKYGSFANLDSILYQYSFNKQRNTTANNYNPGANIALDASIHSFVIWNNLTKEDEITIENKFLQIFNIIGNLTKNAPMNYLDLLYSLVLEKNATDFTKTGISQEMSIWSGSSSETGRVVYYSNNSLNILVDGFYLDPNSDYNSLLNNHSYASGESLGEVDIILARILNAIVGINKDFNQSQQLIYNNSVNENVNFIPTAIFKNKQLYGYGELAPYKIANTDKKSAIFLIISLTALMVTLSIGTPLFVYLTLKRKNKKI